MKVPFLDSDRLIYKPISLYHLSDDYVDWLNDPEVYKYMETRGNYDLFQLKQFLVKCELNQMLFWGIHLKANGLHIGNIKIDPISERHGTGEYGIMMGRKEEWGKGYAFESSKRIIDYCFIELNLRKITLGVAFNNLTAVKLYEKLGFETEGLFKKQLIYDNEYQDVLRMAIFNKGFNYEK